MKLFAHLSVLALATTLASGVLAQDTTTTETEEFPIGTNPEIQVGQTYIKQASGDWNVRCIKVAEGPEPCDIHQILNDPEGNPVAEISVFHLPPGGAAVAGATAVTPLGTLLPAQMTFGIGDAQAKQYPFNWCEAIGCIARLGFTGLELELMKKGDKAQMTVFSIQAPNQPITLTVSLKGFSDGFAQVLVKPN